MSTPTGSATPRPSVGLVVPAYNGGEDLANCLAAIAAMTYPNVLTVVVDNASTDGSIARAVERWPAITVLRQPTNTGFAAACNRGWGALRARGVRYLVLLNQDAFPEPGWLEPLVEHLERHPEVAAAQALLVHADDPTVINSVGNRIHFLGFGYAVGEGLSTTRPEAQRYLAGPTSVTYCSGAAVMLRAQALEDVGLFQDSFFMYHEDLDLGWRLRLAGYASALVPASRVRHRYDFHRSTSVKYEYGERNRLIVLLENYHWLTLLLISPAWLAMEVGVLTASFLYGWFPLKLRGYRYVIGELPAILEVRRRHQQLRRRPERQVVAGFSGTIAYQAEPARLLGLANPVLALYWRLVRAVIVW